MADDTSGSLSSWFGKFYFVLVHFFLFLLGFYMIQWKAKQEGQEKQKPITKKEKSDKSIYHALNSFAKSCFQSRKSSVRIIVNRWIAAVENNVKKELKNIAEVVGKKVYYVKRLSVFFFCLLLFLNPAGGWRNFKKISLSLSLSKRGESSLRKQIILSCVIFCLDYNKLEI